MKNDFIFVKFYNYSMDVIDSLKMCLRILLNVNTTKSQNEIKHVYLKGAKKLRQDL